MTRYLLAFLLLLPATVSAQLPMGIPDFCANSQDVVAVGTSQTWNTPQTKGCLAVRGTLVLSSVLTVTTVMVYEGGFLDVQPGGSLVFLDTPLNAVTDPEQWANGLIVFGRLRMMGTEKTPFVRTAVEPLAGQTSFTLASAPSGWLVGDRVFVPDTRGLGEADWFNQNLVYQHEIRTITALSGATVTLSSALTYDHRGAKDADGTPTVLADGTKLLPHVANLTRSIVMRSQNPSGVRAHMVATSRAAVEMRNVRIEDMGRTTPAPLDSTILVDGKPTHLGTNQIGRYPLHIHMLRGPDNPTNTGYQFTLTGNVVENSLKWPVAIHASHFGLIEGNVIVGGPQLTGAGLSLEDGSETENLIRRNMIADIRGRLNPRTSSPDTANGTTPGSGGECLWAGGFNNRFVENVMAGCRNDAQGVASGAGVKFVTLPWNPKAKNPLVRGADLSNPSQSVEVTLTNQPILQFDGNEVYGLAGTGMTLWLLGTDGYGWFTNQPETVLRDLRVWHTYGAAMWGYPTNKLTMERLVYRVDIRQPVDASGFTAGDYRHVNLTMRDSSIHAGRAFGDVTDPLGTFTFQNNRIISRDYAFAFVTPRTPGTGARPPGSASITMRLSGNTISGWPGQPLRTLSMTHTYETTGGDVVSPYVVELMNEGRAYFQVQTTQNVYGGLAPCTLTRPDIVGIFCASGTPPPADADGDGVPDSIDKCPGTPSGTPVDASGCAIPTPPADADGDGVTDANDKCPGTAAGASVDASGCSLAQKDSDGDGVNDALDKCPNTLPGQSVDASGCVVTVPPTDPCVERPLRISNIRWPAQPTGNRSGSWNSGSFRLTSVRFEWQPSLRLIAVDDRTCSVTVVK